MLMLPLTWVAKVVGQSATVLAIKPLMGGVASSVFSLRLLVDNREVNYVLRQYNDARLPALEPDLLIHEAQSLKYAQAKQLPTPKLIAYDNGDECEVPTLLMSHLEGAVVLRPDNLERYLGGLARTLADIHMASVDEFPFSYSPYIDTKSLQVPSWAQRNSLWQKAINMLQLPQPVVTPCFIHRDYHPTNVLWNNGQVSGVVDWVSAALGPANIDVAHCRLNLSILFDVNASEQFLKAYQSHAAGFVYDTYWDLLVVVDMVLESPHVYKGWRDLGITGLTDRIMQQKVEKYLASILAK
jgi:aminoglycoside phosphotransferase (APT) family kinase protein